MWWQEGKREIWREEVTCLEQVCVKTMWRRRVVVLYLLAML